MTFMIPCFSAEGSNKRKMEEATVMQWVHFLQTVERMLSVYNDTEMFALWEVVVVNG